LAFVLTAWGGLNIVELYPVGFDLRAVLIKDEGLQFVLADSQPARFLEEAGVRYQLYIRFLHEMTLRHLVASLQEKLLRKLFSNLGS
jgi:hypothetical protein